MVDNETGKASFFTLRREGMVCLFIVAAILAVYWQVWDYEFINYDDDQYVTENRQVQAGLTLESVGWAFGSTHAGNWHPLTWLSHMLDCQLYGLNPTGHHLTNVIFHIFNSILLFLIFRRMTGAVWKSAFIAALFAIHPLHVESVAWVAERKDVLSTFFWMLTMEAYLRYVERQKVGRYLAVIFFFALGLLSKPMVITLPFVLLLFDYWPLGRMQPGEVKIQGMPRAVQRAKITGLLLEKVPLLILAAASGVVTFLAQKGGGSVASLDVLPIGARVPNALVSYISYLGKMIWPSDLAVFYPHPYMPPVWQIAGASILLAGVSLLAIKTMRERPSLAVGWAWYIGTLVPVIGLVQVGYQSMADRYTYIPLIGIFVIIAWGVPELAERRKSVLYTASAVIISTLMAITWLQLRYWKDSVTLFNHAIAVTDDNRVAHSALGVSLVDLGRAGEAVEHFREALRINPRYAKTHYNLGIALRNLGRADEAVEHFREALRIDPRYAQAHNNLGVALAGLGRTEEAIVHFREALRIKPHDAQAHSNLGAALAGLGRTEEAIMHFQEALRIDPNSAKGHYNFGIFLASQGGRLDEAVRHFRESLRIDPQHVEIYYNLAVVLAGQGRLDEAAGYLEEALSIEPDYAAARGTLGFLYYRMGDLDRAAAQYRQALILDPGSVRTMSDLAAVYLHQGKDEEAISLFERLSEIQPDNAKNYYNIACLHARQGRDTEALIWLARAIEKGYNNWDLIETDRDLDSIRKLSGYQKIVEGHR